MEAEDTLRQRLREAGAEFKHSFPSSREVTGHVECVLRTHG